MSDESGAAIKYKIIGYGTVTPPAPKPETPETPQAPESDTK
jgi:hypothetical protein